MNESIANETVRTASQIEMEMQQTAVGVKKRFNQEEVGRLIGVSKSTVSRALRDSPRVSPTTRKRIKTVISELNYNPNLFARGLRGTRTGLIGVLSRWIESGFFAELLRHLNDEVKPRGGRLLCSFAPGFDEYLKQWRMFAQSGQVDGIILVAPSQSLFDHSVQPGDVPMVACCADPSVGGPSWAKVDSVNMRNDKAMTQLVDHLYQQGDRKLVHIAGEEGNQDVRERAAAFKKAVCAHESMEGSVEGGVWAARMARDLIINEHLAKRRLPDAFVVFNDTVALATIRVLNEAGLRVPEDIAVTGWDNNIFSEVAGLTTVDIAGKDMARKSVGMLFERMDGRKAESKGRSERVDLTVCLRRSSLGGAWNKIVKTHDQ